MHCERIRFDGDAEYAPAGIAGRDRAAIILGQRGEMFVRAFPHKFAAPAQFAANKRRR